MSLSRKQFLDVALAFAAGSLVPGCSDEEGGDAATGNGSSTASSSSSSSSASSGSGGGGAEGGAGSGGNATSHGGGGAGGGGLGGLGGAGGNAAMGDCQANGTSVTIVDNHGHELVVSKQDVAAAVEKTYDIQGASLHTHAVTLGAAELTQLQNNQQITITSSPGGTGAHTHDIVVTCA